MNLHELFEKFETEFLAGHEKIKTGFGLDLFITKLCEQILGDVYDLEPIYKTGGNFVLNSSFTLLVTCTNSKYWLLATFTNYLKMRINIAY